MPLDELREAWNRYASETEKNINVFDKLVAIGGRESVAVGLAKHIAEIEGK